MGRKTRQIGKLSLSALKTGTTSCATIANEVVNIGDGRALFAIDLAKHSVKWKPDQPFKKAFQVR